MKKQKIDEAKVSDWGRVMCITEEQIDEATDLAPLTLADIYNVIDRLHTHWLETGRDNGFLHKWKNQLLKMNPDIETWKIK